MPMTLKDMPMFARGFPQQGASALTHAQGQPFMQMRGETQMPQGHPDLGGQGPMTGSPDFYGPPVQQQGMAGGWQGFNQGMHPTPQMQPQDMQAFLAFLQQAQGARR